MNYDTLDEIFEEIITEMERQYYKWGDQHHTDSVWLTILIEEVGEAARAILESNDPHSPEMMDELIQVAAVVSAWLEDCRGET